MGGRVNPAAVPRSRTEWPSAGRPTTDQPAAPALALGEYVVCKNEPVERNVGRRRGAKVVKPARHVPGETSGTDEAVME